MDASLSWTDGASANEALLDDLWTLLDGEPLALTDDSARSDSSVASPSPSSPPPTPPPTLPKRKRPKTKCPIKGTLDALRLEAQELTQTLALLRDEVAETHSDAAERAFTERYKRRRAERECEQLRDAVYAQSQFLRGLQSVFSAPPQFTTGLNLCRYLHHYTRLPRDRSVRWTEYAALGQETRLQRAMDVLCRETQALAIQDRLTSTVDAPFTQWEVLEDATGFGVTSTSVYALETRDLSAVLRGVCVAVRDILVRCTSYQCTNFRGDIVDPEASSTASANILYRVLGVHHKSLRPDSDELSVESRVVTLYKQTNDDHAVVLWDFVDDDELHPTTDVTDITRQAVGACLIRRELCDDGVERTVCRLLHTRRYRFHETSSRDKLERFRDYSTATNRENELMFRGIVLDSIATEEAAYARIVGARM